MMLLHCLRKIEAGNAAFAANGRARKNCYRCGDNHDAMDCPELAPMSEHMRKSMVADYKSGRLKPVRKALAQSGRQQDAGRGAQPVAPPGQAQRLPAPASVQPSPGLTLYSRL